MFSHPILRNIKTLNKKFLVIVLPPVILTIWMFTALFIVLTFCDMQTELVSNIQDIADVQAAVLAAPLWNHDDETLEKSLRTLLLNPDILMASVYDANNCALAGIGPQNAVILNKSVQIRKEIIRKTPETERIIGHLSISFHYARIYETLVRQFMRDSLLLLLLVAVIVGSAMVANWLTIGIPLARLLDSVRQVNMENLREQVEWPAQDELGEVVSAYNTLLTNLTAGEEKLGFQAMLMNQIRDGIVASSLEGRITYVNDAVARSLKKARKDLIGQDINALGVSNQGATQREIIERTLAEGKWQGMVVSHASDGYETLSETRTWLVHDHNRTPTGMVGISTDITEKKRTQEALRESEEKYRLLVENATEAITVSDKDGRFLIMNNAAARNILGGHPEEFAGKTLQDVTLEDMAMQRTDRIRKVFESGQGYVREYWLPVHNENRWFRSNVQPIRDSSGKVIAVMDISSDNTEQKQAEISLQQAKEAAEAATRAKDEFLANMSHEIRTPMNIILGFTEILGGLIEDDKQQRYLSTIKSGTKSLLTLINDILDLSRIEAGKLEIEYTAFDPCVVFKEMEQIFFPKIAEKGLEFKVEIDPNLPKMLLLDEIRLRQILFNLIGNAIKFTDSGYVRLSVHWRHTDEDQHMLELIFSVEDTGMGIPEDQRELIFGAFEQQYGQSHAKYGGTGLGLAITKRLVEMMGGKICVTGEKEKGSKFTVILKDVILAPGMTCEDMQIEYRTARESEDIESIPMVAGNIKDLPMLVSALEKEMNGRFEILRKTLLMSAVTDFGERMKKLGETHHAQNLSDFGNCLSEQADAFEVEKIPLTLDSFPSLVDEIRNLI